jgi:glycosyltransferase involved in cell wall biosynthesis
MQNVKVCLGLPVYNGEKYLAQSVESILAQKYRNWELIISDNGSTDGTRRICEAFAAADSRIRYHRNEKNMGASWNFNRVVHLADSPLFRWTSHDDVCAPELLERCVEVMRSKPKIILCYTKSSLIDENGGHLGNYDVRFATDSPKAHERFYDLISRDYLCNQIYGVIRTSVLRKMPLFGDFISTDIHVLAELSLHGLFHEIPEYLFFRRDHPQRSVRANPKPEDFLAWFSPQAKDKHRYTKAKRVVEYAGAISRSPLDAPEKILCYALLGRWVFSRVFGKPSAGVSAEA